MNIHVSGGDNQPDAIRSEVYSLRAEVVVLREQAKAMVEWVKQLEARLDATAIQPIPQSLDAITKQWPEGWKWRRLHGDWEASRIDESGPTVKITDTGDEREDRFALTMAVQQEILTRVDPKGKADA